MSGVFGQDQGLGIQAMGCGYPGCGVWVQAILTKIDLGIRCHPMLETVHLHLLETVVTMVFSKMLLLP